MKMDLYRPALDSVRFSENSEENVLSVLRTRRPQKTGKRLLPALCSAAGIVCILLAVFSFFSAEKTGPLNKSDAEALGVMSVRTVSISSDAVSAEVRPSQMLILDTGRLSGGGDVQLLTGNWSGGDLSYEVGYLADGKYVRLSDGSTADVSARCTAESDTDFCWCIINRSSAAVTFSGGALTVSGDLVWRDFGENAIRLDQGNELELSGISALVNADDLEGIYLYDCENQSAVLIASSTADCSVEITADGSYFVFAVTADGGTVDLKSCVFVKESAPEGSGPTALAG